jgi:hypothetical protein
MGALILPSEFRVSTDDERRKISIKSTHGKYEVNFRGELVTARLGSLVSDASRGCRSSVMFSSTEPGHRDTSNAVVTAFRSTARRPVNTGNGWAQQSPLSSMRRPRLLTRGSGMRTCWAASGAFLKRNIPGRWLTYDHADSQMSCGIAVYRLYAS